MHYFFVGGGEKGGNCVDLDGGLRVDFSMIRLICFGRVYWCMVIGCMSWVDWGCGHVLGNPFLDLFFF